jgi:hypothetical protein
VYQPNDPRAVAPVIPGVNSLYRNASFSGGALGNMVSLNSFLTKSGMVYGNTHLGVFTGKYAYVYLSSGMQIVAYSPNSLDEFAVNGS